MPSTDDISPSRGTGLTDKFKRYVFVGLVVVGGIFALDQLGLSTNSLAQKAKRATRQAAEDQGVSNDCSFLKAPENFRGAQARHRELVSRTTEAFSANSAEAKV